jgi:hypothetical protein
VVALEQPASDASVAHLHTPSIARGRFVPFAFATALPRWAEIAFPAPS